ncbi:hypothetical protein GNZ10_13685 [Ralstonia sp. 3N]|uniref:hypothetical protein n=1 Tax=Ralstonia sp. 3N TaxID=2675750 RepID=UPI0015C55301|nr:hypothetical protein [Ralstonia sp. 3N]NPT50748.1 hypothetical protein [Ralstonia sp. 3N]
MKLRKFAVSAVVVSVLAGCATPYERQTKAFQEEATAYLASPSSAAYKEHPFDEVMFFDLYKIAHRYGQWQYEAVFLMLRDEAAKKHYGLPNQYDDLRARFDSNDQSLPGDAIRYRENATARDRCASFGNVVDSPSFNQCVYKLRQDMAAMKMQFMQQQMDAAALLAPRFDLLPQPNQAAPSPTQYTHCQKLPGTQQLEFSCYTR